jgi:hypothetical protein
MLLTADQHNRIAEVFEEASRDQSIAPADRALLAEKAALSRALARMAEEKMKARRLN